MTSPSPMADAPKPLTDEELRNWLEISKANRNEPARVFTPSWSIVYKLASDVMASRAARDRGHDDDAEFLDRVAAALAASPAPAEALIAVPRKLLVRLHVALSEGRDYARNWSAHTGSINGREFSEATLDLDRELRALTASTAAAGEKDK